MFDAGACRPADVHSPRRTAAQNEISHEMRGLYENGNDAIMGTGDTVSDSDIERNMDVAVPYFRDGFSGGGGRRYPI